MIDPAVIEKQHEARQRLMEYGAMMADRDPRVLYAYRAGLGVSEIARLTGHSRRTVYAVIENAGEQPPTEGV